MALVKICCLTYLYIAKLKPIWKVASIMMHREQAMIDVFERNTYSVVNIIDTTLQVGPLESFDLLPLAVWQTLWISYHL